MQRGKRACNNAKKSFIAKKPTTKLNVLACMRSTSQCQYKRHKMCSLHDKITNMYIECALRRYRIEYYIQIHTTAVENCSIIEN